MNVLKEYKGCQLVERYDRTYIRFWGGREEDMPCEIPVSEADARRVISEASVIDKLISTAKAQIEWTANYFYRTGITEYILHRMNLSQTIAEKSYEKIARHADIRKEFYQYIMNDEAFTLNPIKVEGFTAQYLVTHYSLSILGAYNYLIYLRERPEEALMNLKEGLPRRKIFSDTELKNILPINSINLSLAYSIKEIDNKNIKIYIRPLSDDKLEYWIVCQKMDYNILDKVYDIYEKYIDKLEKTVEFVFTSEDQLFANLNDRKEEYYAI